MLDLNKTFRCSRGTTLSAVQKRKSYPAILPYTSEQGSASEGPLPGKSGENTLEAILGLGGRRHVGMYFGTTSMHFRPIATSGEPRTCALPD
jgi:hypothetical protein